MIQETINRQIIITTILLIVVILLFEFTNFDIDFQKFFYNFENKTWFVSKDEAIADLIFYSGFKKLFIGFSILVVLITIFLFFKKIGFLQEYKKGLLILSLSLVLVPSLSGLKNITNVPCPTNIIEFGGNSIDVKILESYPKDYIQESKHRCWPAGHATMGFSLMALYFLFRTQRNRNIALFFGVTIGILTGGYKILIGDHFLSHTLVTMLAAWLVILLVAKVVNKIKE